jgi:hypothetical protein
MIDHLVYAAPDLDAAITDLETLLGVRASYGGRHPGRGTSNALIALSDVSYLEIVAPDPTQPAPDSPRWFEIDTLTAPRLVTWAAKCANIERVVANAARESVTLGRIATGSRQTTDGVPLSWQMTDPTVVVEDGVVPFLIDWGNSPHPASTAAAGVSLLRLRAEHPEPHRVERALLALGFPLPITRAARPALIATLSTARGDIELR